ncbi:esterase/lipase family protein [Gardnerella pickettii]|uniref:esterase/lipase family protein n=1 Tax=Gardnerella pickettii TaxID=2914924 RepID=UPI003CFC2810
MPWRVKSTITGGEPLSVADSNAYRTKAARLSELSNDFHSLSACWMQTAMQIESQKAALVQNQNNCFSENINQHALQNLPDSNECRIKSSQCESMSNNLSELATLIVRANNLYSQAEYKNRETLDNLVSIGTTIFPIAAVPFFASVGFSAILDMTQKSGMKNFSKWSHATAPIQQGFIRGFSKHFLINPVTGIPIRLFSSIQEKNDAKHSKAPVSTFASALSMFSSKINDANQGNNLKVTKLVLPKNAQSKIFLYKGNNIGQALENLNSLSSGNLSVHPPKTNPDAATIAIQRFRQKDGSTSWLVTIPGTDGKPKSPFGWPQNAEVMSSSRSVRMNADSTRMVVEAMKKSGIKANDNVVLVGHSQGGIVAAGIASDYSKQYNIKHVVTAGSPIANHAIPSKTWVTSIEMEDELVPTLDGASNPSRNNWVTIHAVASKAVASKSANRIKRKEEDEENVSKQNRNKIGNTNHNTNRNTKNIFEKDGILVKNVPEEGTLTHDLNYHQAAYADAHQLASKEIRTQESHFNKILSGKLEETTLWQGVMQH